MQVGGSLDFDEGYVGLRVGANYFGVEVAVVVERYFKALGVGYYVVVGHYIPVGADNYARAEAELLLARLLWFARHLTALARIAEKEIEDVAAIYVGSVATARRGIAFYRHYAVYCRFGGANEVVL